MSKQFRKVELILSEAEYQKLRRQSVVMYPATVPALIRFRLGLSERVIGYKPGDSEVLNG